MSPVNMNSQVPFDREGSTTEVAHIRFLAFSVGVDGRNVHVEGVFGLEGFVAEVAEMVALVAVHSGVFRQSAPVRERLVAHLARIRLVTSVGALVANQR